MSHTLTVNERTFCSLGQLNLLCPCVGHCSEHHTWTGREEESENLLSRGATGKMPSKAGNPEAEMNLPLLPNKNLNQMSYYLLGSLGCQIHEAMSSKDAMETGGLQIHLFYSFPWQLLAAVIKEVGWSEGIELGRKSNMACGRNHVAEAKRGMKKWG